MLDSTGVILHIRSSGADYPMHAECADALISELIGATGLRTLDAAFPAVIIGPLFAPADEWTCAHSECVA